MIDSSKESIKKIPISIIILTFNNETNIDACLSSVANWAGDVWIVDSGSTDRTLNIVRNYTDNIVQHPFENYSKQRNWATATLPLKYEWVFHIDADEKVSSELAYSLETFFTKTARNVIGLMVVRRTVFMGKWIKHGGHYPSYHLRIFKKDQGHCEDRLYDQHFISDGKVAVLEGDLIDYVMSDLNSWTASHMRWAIAEAGQIINFSGKSYGEVKPCLIGSQIERKRWLKEKLYYKTPLFIRPFLYFLYRYIFRMGFLDGKEGLIFHFLQGFWFRFYIDCLVFEMRKNDKQRN